MQNPITFCDRGIAIVCNKEIVSCSLVFVEFHILVIIYQIAGPSRQ